MSSQTSNGEKRVDSRKINYTAKRTKVSEATIDCIQKSIDLDESSRTERTVVSPTGKRVKVSCGRSRNNLIIIGITIFERPELLIPCPKRGESEHPKHNFNQVLMRNCSALMDFEETHGNISKDVFDAIGACYSIDSEKIPYLKEDDSPWIDCKHVCDSDEIDGLAEGWFSIMIDESKLN